ncbi:MAG TPA: hypothetical protein PK829_04660 [Promineifilum sp.]|nr:hypothetical protein [Promineifilum sp.]HQF70001.1 hypothetical protein [Promineifilum sp.]
MIVQTAQLHSRRAWLLALLILLLVAGCRGGGSNLPWEETFNEAGSWSTGEDAYSRGNVSDGAYVFEVLQNDISRWAAAGQNFGDGIYELEATQVSGPLDNGYGLLFRANAEAGNFYLFKVSGDGYVWLGRYQDGAEAATLVGDHWFESAAVQQGLNVTNRLTVRAEAGNMIFYVNGQEVGRVTDNTLASGDVGVLVQTLGGAPVVVRFDGLTVKALD